MTIGRSFYTEGGPMKKTVLLGLLWAACTGADAPDNGQPGASDATAGAPDAKSDWRALD